MKIELNDSWFISWRNKEPSDIDSSSESLRWDGQWIPAAVPGDVHSSLYHAGLIEDPFFAHNVEKCRWVENKVWIYRKDFECDNLEVEQNAELLFEGLDTFATVTLNGKELGKHNNMFTAVSFDVTGKLLPGTNHLEVQFDPCIEQVSRKNYERMWYSMNRERVWIRKAQMNFRWDWGPRLVTAGIWKEVVLNFHDKAKIDNVFVRTTQILDDMATVLIDVEIRSLNANQAFEGNVSIFIDGGTIVQTEPTKDGCACFSLNIEHPALWWTHDIGSPKLYLLEVELKSAGQVIDSRETQFGIRTLEVKQKNAQGENRFTFVLNGIELFARGANWIPANNMIGAIKDEAYQEWITLAREGNMNMLRIWGGGIYEKDIFYQECDKQGILVWQDFMFACSSYPDFDADFMREVEEEITFSVKSLRNHTCLALWCGNNEIQWLHGAKMHYLKDTYLYGEKIYHDLMPELLKKLDPSRLYWPSSPFGGNDPNSDTEGDRHNWQVWAGTVFPHKQGEQTVIDDTPEGISYKLYEKDMCKFVSEFGIHAAPELKTLQSCIPEEELYFDSFEMRYRNRDKRPTRGSMTLESTTGIPKNLKEYIDFSMLSQAEGLKFGIEHYRRRFPECSGALLWQLNDSWPTVSWSIVDFYCRPKAGYYAVKKAYAPVLLSFKEEIPDLVSLWVSNNSGDEFNDSVEVGLKDFFGNCEFVEAVAVSIPAHASLKVRTFSKNRINVSYMNFEFLYCRAKSGTAEPNTLFFKEYKELNFPPCQLQINTKEISNSRFSLFIKTDCFAKFVKILTGNHVKLSDNYFDIMPGEEKQVFAEIVGETTQEPPEFKICALNHLN